MDKRKDYYQLLGVDRDASTAAIKRAFRRLARQYRPEVSPDTAEDVFHDLQTAYETLADAEQRRRYDETLQRERLAPLAWSFVRSPAAGDLRRPVQPNSLSGEILLSPREATAGGVMPLQIPLVLACPACEGTGGSVFDCDRCGGEGTLERRLPVAVRIPAGIKDGAVFQVKIDDPAVLSVLLTVHIGAF